jgi:alpha-mannosidase
LCASGARGLCQTVFFDGQEHTLNTVKTEVVAAGPVLARLKVTGQVQGIEIVNCITLYAELDQVDFDLRIRKPVTTQKQRLCQVFPVLSDRAELRIETPGAVIRPRPQPQGDLLAGADTSRFGVQGFVDASAADGPGVTIAPLDAFALRLDLEPLTFEALGNDQNYREVTQDQDGVTSFRFRYILRGHTGGYDNPEAIAWSRSVTTPLVSVLGRMADGRKSRPTIRLDPSRAVATCLKPADGDSSGGFVLRLWETAGQPDPVRIELAGYRQALQTDLLERDRQDLPITDGHVAVPVNPHGLAGLRLRP